jgi:hypothetical protein
VVVSKSAQTIAAFAAVSPKVFGAAPFAVTVPAATSQLPVVLSVKSGPATVSGNTVTITGAGTVVLAANQGGDANFSAAREVTTSFAVTKQNVGAAVTLSNTNHVFDGTAKGVTVATVPEGLATVVTYNASTNRPTNAGTYAVVATISNADYQGSKSASMLIAKAAQNIGFDQPVVPVFSNNATFTLVPSNSSSLPVSFVSANPAIVTVAGNVATIKGAGTVTLTATNTGNANYLPAGFARTVTVNKANQTVTFNPPASQILVAGKTFPLSASANSGIPLTFTSSNTNVVSVAGNVATLRGVGEAVLTARNSGNANYNTVEFPRSISISPPPAASGIYKGTFKRQLFPGLAVPAAVPADNSVVSFTVSPDLQSCTFAGRIFPLAGDSRPTSLVYAITSGSPMASLTLRLNPNGVVTSFEGQYSEPGIPVRSAGFLSQEGSVAKQP